jgi:CBS domain-containing protein
MNFRKHLINRDSTIKSALESLSNIGLETILFAINNKGQLIGSLTDGDIRRGLLKGISLNSSILEIINPNPKYLRKDSYSIDEINKLRDNNYMVVPVVNSSDIILNISHGK